MTLKSPACVRAHIAATAAKTHMLFSLVRIHNCLHSSRETVYAVQRYICKVESRVGSHLLTFSSGSYPVSQEPPRGPMIDPQLMLWRIVKTSGGVKETF